MVSSYLSIIVDTECIVGAVSIKGAQEWDAWRNAEGVAVSSGNVIAVSSLLPAQEVGGNQSKLKG